MKEKEKRKFGQRVRKFLLPLFLAATVGDNQLAVEDQLNLVQYLAQYHARYLPPKIGELFWRGEINQSHGAEIVKRYFSAQSRDLTIEDQVEAIIAQQITNILENEGIAVFPPLLTELTEAPKTLYTSPRDKIEIKKQTPLKSEISLAQMERLEEKEESRNPKSSAVVVENDGWAITYPTAVVRHKTLEQAIETISHEWVHQYLAFKPLGFLYFLDVTGFRKNYEIANLNEVVATMVGREITQKVMEAYYPTKASRADVKPAPTTRSFDFNQAVWEIGRVVQGYLKQGQVEEAERFMEKERKNLTDRGYPVRKLNTAYLASHGLYPVSTDADHPDRDTKITTDPISALLEKKTSNEEMIKRLREKSSSLKDFLDKASWITSRNDLKELAQPPTTSVVIFER